MTARNNHLDSPAAKNVPVENSFTVERVPLQTLSTEELEKQTRELITRYVSQSIEDTLAIGQHLTELYGYARKVDPIPGRKPLSKENWAKLWTAEQPDGQSDPAISYSYARMLIKMANTPRMTNADNWQHFPPRIGSQIEISRLSDTEFERGMEAEVRAGKETRTINSLANRAEIKKLRKPPDSKPHQKMRLVSLEIPETGGPDDTFYDAIHEIKRLAEQWGLGFNWSDVTAQELVSIYNDDEDVRQWTILIRAREKPGQPKAEDGEKDEEKDA